MWGDGCEGKSSAILMAIIGASYSWGFRLGIFFFFVMDVFWLSDDVGLFLYGFLLSWSRWGIERRGISGIVFVCIWISVPMCVYVDVYVHLFSCVCRLIMLFVFIPLCTKNVSAFVCVFVCVFKCVYVSMSFCVYTIIYFRVKIKRFVKLIFILYSNTKIYRLWTSCRHVAFLHKQPDIRNSNLNRLQTAV